MRGGSPGAVLVCMIAKQVVTCLCVCASCLLMLCVSFVMFELVSLRASYCHVCVAVLVAMSLCFCFIVCFC